MQARDATTCFLLDPLVRGFSCSRILRLSLKIVLAIFHKWLLRVCNLSYESLKINEIDDNVVIGFRV